MSPPLNAQTSPSAPDPWDESVVDGDPDARDSSHPRKRRRKYIAKAW